LWLSFYFRDIIFVFLISFTIMMAVNLVYWLLTRKRVAQIRAVPVQKKYIIHTQTQKINLFPLFKAEPKTSDLEACVSATDREANTYIAAKSFSPAVKKSAKSKNITLLQFRSRAHMMFTMLKFVTFQRKKVRSYIFMGIIILATSFLVRFNIYYIVIATVMFSFALLSLFALPLNRGNTFTRGDGGGQDYVYPKSRPRDFGRPS
jgi:hypothetical protein